MADRVRLRVFAVLAPLYLALAWRSWFVCDDAFIAFRYARHWARGRGLRFNTGDAIPVEGYSEFLWVALGAASVRLGLDPVQVLPLVGVLSGLAVLWLTLGLGRRLGLGEAATGVAGLALVSLPPFTVWATGGLATMLHALLVLAAVDLLAFRERSGAAAAVGVALVLVRVEGPAWVGVVAVAGALGRWSRGRPVRGPVGLFLAASLGVFAVFETWRLATYHAWIAHTVTAKVGLGPESAWRGLRYVASFFLTLVTPIAAIPVLGVRRAEVGVLAVPVVATVAYGVLAGGDFMAHFRLLVPALPFLALLLGIGVQAGWDRLPRGRVPIAALASVAVALGALPAFDLHLLPRAVRARHEGVRILDPERADDAVTSEQQHWQRMRDRVAGFTRLGRALNRAFPRDASIVLSAVGAHGWYSRLTVFDRNGLVSRVPEGPEREGRLPGHDRTLPVTAFLPLEPTILFARLLGPVQLCRRARRAARQHRQPGYVPVLRPSRGQWLLTVERSEAAWADAWANLQRVCDEAERGVSDGGP